MFTFPLLVSACDESDVVMADASTSVDAAQEVDAMAETDAAIQGHLTVTYSFEGASSCELAEAKWADLYVYREGERETSLQDQPCGVPLSLESISEGELRLEVVSWDQKLWTGQRTIQHSSAGTQVDIVLQDLP